MAKAGKLTPMLQQYLLTKEAYKDCILLYRLGDFYEMFFDDAITASRELEIVLTGRDCGLEERAPMCGVPYHSVDGYIKKLIEKGYKVAICEQLTDPALSKGLVERDVVRVITPGTVIEDSMIDRERNTFILSLYAQGERLGMAWCDVSTGEFFTDEITTDDMCAALQAQIARIDPAEIITDDSTYLLGTTVFGACNRLVTPVGAWTFAQETAAKALYEQFHVQTLGGFGLKETDVCVAAAGALVFYLNQTQKVQLTHINHLQRAKGGESMELDAHTKRNLELTQPMMGSGKRGTLLWVLDHTKSAQGTRLLRKWIEQPLQQREKIEARLDAVDALVQDYGCRESLREILHTVYDLERLCGKISYGTLNARDAQAIGRTLRAVPQVREVLSGFSCTLMQSILVELQPLDTLAERIEKAIVDDPPSGVRDGGIIRDGYDEEVDKLRNAYTQGRSWLADLEAREREATGIRNLKIGYNKVFGYFLEVTKSQIDQVPYRYVRKQTLANAERYITEELKELEETILGAEEKCMRLEYQLFVTLREAIAAHMDALQGISRALAQIDAVQSLAVAAYENQYVRPQINQQGILQIEEGRHPVVEKTVQGFVPNNAILDSEENRFLIITGPNMSGKSTYMRQVAMIALMAHIGSFVPAKTANICVIDRIFTRVGASDDLASGRSTFMVEMVELANILHNATAQSLIILDEIGRGTSTFDGLSIAWAAAEYICNQQSLGAKALFATHYHELAELEGHMQGVKNYCVLAKEVGDDILFLHRIVRGGTDKSFGIQVAKLAGVPQSVLTRAKEILQELRKLDVDGHILGKVPEIITDTEQLTLFNVEEMKKDEVLEALRAVDIASLTPLEALNQLNELQQKAVKLQ